MYNLFIYLTYYMITINTNLDKKDISEISIRIKMTNNKPVITELEEIIVEKNN